jgi:hypothetical protein
MLKTGYYYVWKTCSKLFSLPFLDAHFLCNPRLKNIKGTILKMEKIR